jgi:dihydrofolate reductase
VYFVPEILRFLKMPKDAPSKPVLVARGRRWLTLQWGRIVLLIVGRSSPDPAWRRAHAECRGLNCGARKGEGDMPRLVVFNNVTLDGYFAGKNGDIGWAHRDQKDAEWDEFVAENASAGGRLLLGRVTYELMASYWPSPAAAQNAPVMAEQMNSLPKTVFSRTLDRALWSNTKLVKGGLAEEVRAMKRRPGEDIAILGSGSIVRQLVQEGLIDEYQIVVNPIVLGAGRTMFEGLKEKLPLKRTRQRAFGNGNVLLCYEPTA